jgi:hypothetical protein
MNGNSIAQLEKLGDSLQKGIIKLMGGDDNNDKVIVSKRKQVIYEKIAVQEKAILFYQKFPNNDKMQKAMEAAMDKYMQLTIELQEFLDEEADDK